MLTAAAKAQAMVMEDGGRARQGAGKFGKRLIQHGGVLSDAVSIKDAYKMNLIIMYVSWVFIRSKINASYVVLRHTR